MYQDHPSFEPPSDDAGLWKYLDFPKFVSMLNERSLYFARADRLVDPFEGAHSNMNKMLRPVLYKDVPEDQFETMVASLEAIPEKMRQVAMISCWFSSTHESSSMWNQYSDENYGVAIKTDFKSLKTGLTCEDEIYIGRVNYVDYNTTFIPENPIFLPLLHKRIYYASEQEVRAMSADLSKIMHGDDRLGVHQHVDLSILVHEVVVAPSAEEWFVDLVRDVVAKYGLQMDVRKSSLSEIPNSI